MTRQRLARRVPAQVVALELGEVELVADVAGQDQGPLGAPGRTAPGCGWSPTTKRATNGTSRFCARIDSRLDVATVSGSGPPNSRLPMSSDAADQEAEQQGDHDGGDRQRLVQAALSMSLPPRRNEPARLKVQQMRAAPIRPRPVTSRGSRPG